MSEIEAVENKGCKQEVNYSLECGHVWPSWIFIRPLSSRHAAQYVALPRRVVVR